jgi:hypothetical protein
VEVALYVLGNLTCALLPVRSPPVVLPVSAGARSSKVEVVVQFHIALIGRERPRLEEADFAFTLRAWNEPST